MAAGPENQFFIEESGGKYLFKCYSLNPFRDLPNFPHDQGIYIFAKEIHNNVSGFSDYEVLYIGETNSFKGRPVSEKHEKWEHAHRLGANRICIFTKEVSDTLERKSIENDLIDKYDPICNKDNPFQLKISARKI